MPQPLHWGRVAVETFYKPVRTIGGDFGLVFPFDGTHLNLLVCDISGHGISSALLANRIYTETVSLLRHGMEPDEMLRALNRIVIEDIMVEGFIFTMATARLDFSARQLVYAGGGHPPAFLISSSGKVRRIKPLGTVLGRIAEAVPESAAEEFKLSAGDRLMLYSDGLTDVWNGNDEILGVEGLERINHPHIPDEKARHLREALFLSRCPCPAHGPCVEAIPRKASSNQYFPSDNLRLLSVFAPTELAP